MKPRFSTLILLILLTAVLMTPFAVSPLYLSLLRDRAFDLYQFLGNNLYKQITGYTSLALVAIEMVFTARKRGRGWILKLSIPGSMVWWRSFHIFGGVALVGTTLIHTAGARGLNFNGIFLGIFWGVTLSALVGVVAETGILESSRKYFGWSSTRNGIGRFLPGMAKGPLIRQLRALWLSTHIILVCIFLVMLGFHIFLAYYYQ